jgi:hypothetical protein
LLLFSADYEKRPSFKDIIRFLDDILVDLAIEDAEGRRYWKQNFLAPKQVRSEKRSPQFLIFDFFSFLTFAGVTRVREVDRISSAPANECAHSDQ